MENFTQDSEHLSADYRRDIFWLSRYEFETTDEELVQTHITHPQTFISFENHKPKKEPENKTNVNLPLEIRISRINLEERQRPKNTLCRPSSCTRSNNNNNTTPNKLTNNKMIKRQQWQRSRLKDQQSKSDMDELSLGSQVNPLMTILMSPHFNDLIDQEKRFEVKSAQSKRTFHEIKVKSLDFPENISVEKHSNRIKSPYN